MKVTRWGVSAGLALFLAGAGAFAGDTTDELNAMKASMDNMKQEMESMRSTMASEREAMRANAGGAPESLKSANGKATVKIGGEFQVRYSAEIASDYNNNVHGSQQNSNQRYTRTSWDIYKTEINFKIDLSCDTYGFIALRPDRGDAAVSRLLDQAFWKWNNIGGTGFGAKVGLFKPNIGMYDSDVNPWGRVMILDPMVKTAGGNYNDEAGQFTANRSSGVGANGTLNGLVATTDKRVIGTAVDYKFDQVTLTAAIYGNQTVSTANDPGYDSTAGVTSDGSFRNLDIQNHYVTATYDPCWLENLHFQGSYFGEFDNGEGASSTSTWLPSDFDAVKASRHGATYTPGVMLGAFYKADKWAVYAEAAFIANPNYYQDSNETVLSLGADYSLTEKLKLGGSFDWKKLYGSRYYGSVNNGTTQLGAGDSVFDSDTLRAALGAKYDFGNGLYVQAQYAHYWVQGWGLASNDMNCKDADALIFQTGFKF